MKILAIIVPLKKYGTRNGELKSEILNSSKLSAVTSLTKAFGERMILALPQDLLN